MSVYTTVTQEQLAGWLKNYPLGELQKMQGILSGIENTNYFVNTSSGQFVLTLFEHMRSNELPYYAHLMSHLAKRGFACPIPIANSAGEFIGRLNGKPALIISFLPGESVVKVTPDQCEQVGVLLAQLHQAGQGFPHRMVNPRGPHWWKSCVKCFQNTATHDELALINSEIDFQSKHSLAHLPHGVIHGDLFRDNVLWNLARASLKGGHGLTSDELSKPARIGGVIDFYFACDDALLLDVAITANDWCLLPDATLDQARLAALLRGYRPDKKYSDAERVAWPILLRAAALRTWLGRLGYNYFPLKGELTFKKDAGLYQHLLHNHIKSPIDIDEILT